MYTSHCIAAWIRAELISDKDCTVFAKDSGNGLNGQSGIYRQLYQLYVNDSSTNSHIKAYVLPFGKKANSSFTPESSSTVSITITDEWYLWGVTV